MADRQTARRQVAEDFFGDEIARKLLFCFRINHVFYGLAFYGFLSMAAVALAIRVLHWHVLDGTAFVAIYGTVFVLLLLLTVWSTVARAKARTAIRTRFGEGAAQVQVRTMNSPAAFRTWCETHNYAAVQ